MPKKLAIAICAFAGATLTCTSAHAFLLAGLTDAEQSYHEQIFSYAMDNTQPGGKYDWKTYSGNGTFTIGKPFISKSGSNCRDFTEVYTIQGYAPIEIKGFGCKRTEKDGWCSVKTNNALTCALEKRDYMSGHRYVEPSYNPAAHASGGGGGDSGGGGGGGMGGGGSVSAPNVSAPNVNMPKGGKGGDPTAKGVAYDVTDTLGNAGAKGTALGLSWWDALFR